MKTLILFPCVVLLTLCQIVQAEPMGTAFHYQGLLSKDGLYADGSYDFKLTLFDSLNGGTGVGPVLTTNGVPVTNGLFILTLDFGSGIFDGTAYWLETEVRTNEPSLEYTLLEPRRRLRPMPYGLYASRAGTAQTAASLLSSLPSDQLVGTYQEELNFSNPANIFQGDGSGLTELDASNLADGTIPDARLSANVARRNSGNTFNGNQIIASGNLGVGAPTPTEKLQVTGNVRAEGFLGPYLTALDNQPLEFRVGGERALLLGPASDGVEGSIPNLLGGWINNTITDGVVGAVIGGGGDPLEGNNPRPNRVTDHYGVVGGGAGNRAGDGDATLGDAKYATVGGGYANDASGSVSTVGGGWYNRATYERATVAGGWNNLASAHASTVGGGRDSTASGVGATVPGGLGNLAQGQASFAAGRRAKANHDGAFVWADFLDQDFLSTGPNQFLIRAAGGVGIGTENPQADLHVAGTVRFALTSSPEPGAMLKAADADGDLAWDPYIRSVAASAGPYDRSANIVCGANLNSVSNGIIGATISGGGYMNSRFPSMDEPNSAHGHFGTVPGGSGNTAGGHHSFAAGHGAQALHNGTFVWADRGSSLPFASTRSNQFLIRARGGVGIGTSNPQAALDVNGTTRTSVLTITGGADLAEPFPITEADVPKGAIVVIDEEKPGQLKLSTQAYDTRVAGIVSGANGIQPGLTLSQEGGLDQGRHVALSGRVYALADASSSPIRPGDLLTTSDTPGHAMKVTDHAQATGAILGKAMSPLTEGRGLVLVLVSLQ